MENFFIIDHEQLQFDKSSVWNLIEIHDKPDGSLLDHNYFCIHDGVFDINQSNHQDKNIILKFISNEPNKNEYKC